MPSIRGAATRPGDDRVRRHSGTERPSTPGLSSTSTSARGRVAVAYIDASVSYLMFAQTGEASGARCVTSEAVDYKRQYGLFADRLLCMYYIVVEGLTST